MDSSSGTPWFEICQLDSSLAEYKRKTLKSSRRHLKNRILAQGQGGTEFQPAGILKYVEDLKRGPNTEIGQKDLFEIASIYFETLITY